MQWKTDFSRPRRGVSHWSRFGCGSTLSLDKSRIIKQNFGDTEQSNGQQWRDGTKRSEFVMKWKFPRATGQRKTEGLAPRASPSSLATALQLKGRPRLIALMSGRRRLVRAVRFFRFTKIFTKSTLRMLFLIRTYPHHCATSDTRDGMRFPSEGFFLFIFFYAQNGNFRFFTVIPLSKLMATW